MAEVKLTHNERAFLEGVRDGDDVFPVVREIGYGWAVKAGFVRQVGAHGALDFRITDAGRAALSEAKP